MNSLRIASAAILALVLSACGGGGGGGGGSSSGGGTPAAPSGLSYAPPAAFSVGTAIAQLTPTVTGSPTGYSISPALPPGLSISATTGVISGSPTAAQAATSYTITASNAGGSTTATLSITITDIAPVIQYPRASYKLSAQMAVSNLTPFSSAGAATSWSVTPALPTGLALDPATGAITGTPYILAAASTYVITATNSGGADTFDLTLSVVRGVLTDLGHASDITNLDYSGSRILSVDQQRHAVLWKSDSNVLLRFYPVCDNTCPQGEYMGALAGNTVGMRSLSGLDLYDATSGNASGHIDAPVAQYPRFRIATDGSYVALQGTTQLAVYGNTGATMFTRAGNYSDAVVYAAPGELRVARPSPGGYALETIAVPTGTSIAHPGVGGSFGTWSEDGEQFVAVTGTGIAVYSRLGVSIGGSSSPPQTVYGGFGAHFWALGGTRDRVEVYAVGGSGTPIATYSIVRNSDVVQSGALLTFVAAGNGRTISMIDLSATTLVKTDFTVPVNNFTQFAARSSSDWVFGTRDGVVMNGPNSSPPFLFSMGRVLSMTASESRMAASTAGGPILIYSTVTRELERVLDFRSYKVHLSTDGSRLTAGSHLESSAVRVFSMPAGNVIADWTRPAAPVETGALDVTDDGHVALISTRQGSGTSTTYSHRLLHLDATPVTEDALVNITEPLARISPSGNRIAASTLAAPHSTPGQPSTTRLYENGVLATSFDGWNVGWIDNSRVLVNRYTLTSSTTTYANARLINTGGQELATLTFDEQFRIQALGSDLFYSDLFNNKIFDATTGATVWSTPNSNTNVALTGTATSDTVFYSFDSTLRAETR